MESTLTLTPIGIIHSPHLRPEETPIQPVYADDIAGIVEVFPAYAEGLAGLEQISHIQLLFWLHRSGDAKLTVVPFLQDEPRGVFATCAPRRPNPLGLSLVELLRVEGRRLHVRGLDILDGTPLLDIKPYFPRFAPRGPVRVGWQTEIDEAEARRRGRRGYRGPAAGPAPGAAEASAQPGAEGSGPTPAGV